MVAVFAPLRSHRHTRRNLGLAAIPLLAAALLAAGCGASGGTATIAIPREPAAFVDWCIADEAEADLAGLLFRKLARPGSTPGEWVPDLAASWEILPDGRSIRVILRDGVLWDDGAPLTAKDVVFSQERGRGPGSALAFVKRDIAAVEADGAGAILIRSRGDARLALAGALTGGIYPEHLLGGVPLERVCTDPFNRRPTGSGPFRLEERAPGEPLDFVRRRGAGSSGVPGEPRLTRVVAKVLPDRAAVRDALADGEVDYVELLHGEDPARIAVPGRTRVVAGKPRSFYALAWNTGRRPFDVEGIRRALGRFLTGAAAGVGSRQELVDAGLRHNAAGDWLGADGRPLMVSLMSDGDTASRGTAAAIATSLRGAGFTVETRSGSPDEIRSRMRGGDYSALLLRLPVEGAEAARGVAGWTLLHEASSPAVVGERLAGPEENPRRPLAVIERWSRKR